ncbi:uncharacterized protein [Palaemon carinicauda]|uniref:uncharacterized protein n=1 Tax=Palaemon carinicauda TaxID=392227 RepID=UPI0035B67776
MSSFHSLPPPATFNVDDRNAAERWREWRERWKCYAVTIELSKKTPEVQVSVLLTVIGPEAHEVSSTFQLSDEDQKDQNAVLAAFERYFHLSKNTAFERYHFNIRAQIDGESFDQYVTALRHIAWDCDIANITQEEILRDRIMFGISDDKVRDRLLRERNLTLERTLEICGVSEVSIAQQEEINRVLESKVITVSAKLKDPVGRMKPVTDVHRKLEETDWITDCRFCGKSHRKVKEVCPAWGKRSSMSGVTN